MKATLKTNGTVVVRLSLVEVFLVGVVGVLRRLEGRKKGRKDRYADEGGPSAWDREIEGAGGEMAVAGVLNKFWHAIASNLDDLPGDVGEYEVRTTSRDNGSLIVKPDEDPEKRYYLVTGTLPTVVVQGSITGDVAKQDRYFRKNVPFPAFFVPQSDLEPIHSDVAV